jgi:hypothetical protein
MLGRTMAVTVTNPPEIDVAFVVTEVMTPPFCTVKVTAPDVLGL